MKERFESDWRGSVELSAYEKWNPGSWGNRSFAKGPRADDTSVGPDAPILEHARMKGGTPYLNGLIELSSIADRRKRKLIITGGSEESKHLKRKGPPRRHC